MWDIGTQDRLHLGGADLCFEAFAMFHQQSGETGAGGPGRQARLQVGHIDAPADLKESIRIVHVGSEMREAHDQIVQDDAASQMEMFVGFIVAEKVVKRRAFVETVGSVKSVAHKLRIQQETTRQLVDRVREIVVRGDA